jgi:threonine dehydrogenase-like Zn-dependent dehydrogenase
MDCRCRALWLTGPNSFEASILKQSARPNPGHIRIKMVANGHCESDINVARKGRHESQSETEGNGKIMLGHEPVGYVIAVGEGVTSFTGGEMVAIEPGIACGQCIECNAARYNLCRKVRYMATPSMGWNCGSYAHEVDWPADLAHLVPEGLDPLVAALTESFAAGREAIAHMERTVDFNPHEETVLIIGAGQMAINILLQLRRVYPMLKVGLVARKDEDRLTAEKIGAAFTLPLSGKEWKSEISLESIVHAASAEKLPAQVVQQRVAEYKAALEHNEPIQLDNIAMFKNAREIAGEKIACVIECTGQPHILNAALAARVIRGEGMYLLVSCLYQMSLDIANIRRDGGVVTNLRRSRNKFPCVLKDLAANEAHYRQILGRVVEFDRIPELYMGTYKGEKIGDGPKTIILYPN